MQTAITLGAEFHRRLVAQRTVRPDSVVLAPPPSCFAAGIGHRFEFLAIQELVTQSAMKRLDEAILPRTRRRHRDCFRSRLWKPTGQDLTDELRAVVAADPRWRSAATYHARQHPAYVRPGHRRADVERQALPSIFVHQREPLERTSVGGAIDDEIARPHVVLETRRLVHATVGAATRHAGFPGFLAARRSPETEFVPQPPHAFAIHAPALMPQSRVNALVAIARMPPGQSPDRLDQSIFAGTLPATITDGRTRSAQDPAGAARCDRSRANSPRPLAAAWRSPLFFSDVLEHLFVEHQLGTKTLEPIDLGLQFADSPCVIDLGRVEPLAPALIGSLTDAELTADVGEREPLGAIAIGFTQEALNLVSGPSLAHESLPGLCQGDEHNSWTNFWGADQLARSKSLSTKVG